MVSGNAHASHVPNAAIKTSPSIRPRIRLRYASDNDSPTPAPAPRRARRADVATANANVPAYENAGACLQCITAGSVASRPTYGYAICTTKQTDLSTFAVSNTYVSTANSKNYDMHVRELFESYQTFISNVRIISNLRDAAANPIAYAVAIDYAA